jgi:hypothetical protein
MLVESPEVRMVLVRMAQTAAMNATGILLGHFGFIVPSNGSRQH